MIDHDDMEADINGLKESADFWAVVFGLFVLLILAVCGIAGCVLGSHG
jgi:hypothetical protein